MDPNPPKAGYVTTRKAAQLYGCSPDALLRAMKQEGIDPLVTTHEARTGGRLYWWDPMQVLKTRAVRAERQVEAKRLLSTRAKAGTLVRDRRGATLKGRQTRLESYRKTLLARIAARTA